MMKRKLLLLLFTLLTMVGAQQAKAYTVGDLTSAGWTLVTVFSDDASNENYVGNFVYVFVDAGSSNYAVSGETTTVYGYGGKKPTYRTLANPCITPYTVWTLETRDGGYAMRNIKSAKYFNSNSSTDGTTKGSGWNDTMSDDYPAGTFTFAISSEKYSIQGVSSEALVGPWNNEGSVKNDGEAIAANKVTAEAPGFFIYRMAKGTYALKYLQQCPNVEYPVDMTYLIVNPTIYSATQATSSSRAINTDVAIGETGWTAWKSLRNNDNYTAGSGNTKLEAWAGGWKMNIDYYQRITSLPSGKYSVTAYAHFNKNSESGNAYVYVYGSGGGDKKRSDAMSAADADLSTLYVDVASGYINIGIDTPEEITQDGSTALYLTADNFRLSADPYISTMATELPDGGAMTAGLWYSFSVEATGNYDLSGSSALNDIIYTTGSTTALKDAGSTKFTATMVLTAGVTYYLRSSSDNTFSAVPDIATASQELPNSAVTAGSWYRFTTGNSSDAYVLSSNGDATVTYTTDGTKTIDDEITDTWTLTYGSITGAFNAVLAPSTTYYIKSDAAVTLTKTETSVSSSFVTGWTKVTSCEQLAANPKDYFFAIFSANNTGLYLINRNETHNEKLRYVTAGNPLSNIASLFEVENYDGDFVLKSVVNNKYFENRPTTNPRFSEDGPWNYHADLAEIDENCRTTLSFHDGVCTIQDKNDGGGNNHIGLWYTNEKHGYIHHEILAGNKSEALKASFIIYRIPKVDCDDLTAFIKNADFSSTEGWTQEHPDITKPEDKFWELGNGLIGTYAVANEIKSTTDATHLATEYCLGIQCRWRTCYAAFTQTTSLPLGYYTLTFDVQNANTSTTSATYENRFKVTVGDKTYTDDKTEWMSGNSAWTTHTISFPVTGTDAATISLGYGMGENNFGTTETPHLYVSHLKLNYAPIADTDDYAALNNAISAAESKTIGFETGEYAPYNNTDALEKLAAAKAIDQEAINRESDVKDATDALMSAAWIANTKLMDAVYDGGFLNTPVGDVHDGVTGWTTPGASSGDESVFRQVVSATKFESDRGLYIWPNTFKYGEKEGYTMPLKANSYYKFTISYGGWESSTNSPTVSILNTNGEGLTATQPGSATPYTSGVKTYETVFKTGAAGNYVLSFITAENINTVIGDIHLTYVGDASAEMAVNSTAKWGTFCAPFEVAIPSGVAAYSCASATDAGNLNLEEITTGTIPANTPVILNAEGGLASTTFYGIKVPNESDDLIISGLLVGNVGTAGKTITDKDKENGYLLQIQDGKAGFYKMNPSNSYKIGFNRCYLKLKDSGGARAAFYMGEDDPTGISALEAAKAGADAQKDGKYIIEGKIVLVKNGVKYGANGQIVK